MSKKKFSRGLTVFLAIACLIAGCAVGVLGAITYDALTYHSDEPPRTVVSGELQIHFLELGNKYTGDCTYIKAGENDILIDAGSRPASVATIKAYIDQYVTDGTLEYVIVTHAHQDHYAGFSVTDGSIFDLYEVGTIIDFAETNQENKGSSNMYGRYLLERQAEIDDGKTEHYTAKECIDQEKDVFDLGSGISMTVLDNKYYHEKSAHENNYSVCTLFTYGDDSYLFTGDLEEDGEAELVARNDLPEVTVYKAGHHGSKTSSSEELLSVIKPEIVCVCCCAGATEYTSNNANTFPTQAFVDRVAPYTDRVYVTTLCLDYDKGTFTSMNGNIVILTDKSGVSVVCSGEDKVLKEWDWFKQSRACPDAWK
ncbi:MAG: MBL fold metallo-hydrolase [Clostridia bacterium]|nr:MBL fold metallo-hydrolase [Clostridia bacterium]